VKKELIPKVREQVRKEVTEEQTKINQQELTQIREQF
jgi:hypothetical protein